MDNFTVFLLTFGGTMFFMRYIVPDEWARNFVTSKNVPWWVSLIAVLLVAIPVVQMLGASFAVILAILLKMQIDQWVWIMLVCGLILGGSLALRISVERIVRSKKKEVS